MNDLSAVDACAADEDDCGCHDESERPGPWFWAATAAGVPARVVRINGRKLSDALNHVNIPDPLAMEVERLEGEIKRLSERVDGLTAEK